MGPMRRTISIALQGMGFDDIAEAKNGRDAFNTLEAQHDIPGKRIDIAIVDWNMAPLTGLDLLKMTRKDRRFRDIFFIMITAEQLQDNVVAAIQAGVDEYIVKPFTANTLKEKFVSVARRRLREINGKIEEQFSRAGPVAGVMENEASVEDRLGGYRKELRRLFAFTPWSYLAPLELGRLSLRMNDYADAEKWLRKTIAKDFGLPEAHKLLSEALKAQGKVAESVKELEIAVVERPSSGELRQKLGEAYLREGRLDEAMTTLAEAIGLLGEPAHKSQLARSKNAMGQARLQKSDKNNDDAMRREAVLDIQAAVKLDPALVSAHYNLMVAYKKTGRASEAARVLDRIQAMEPKDAEGWIAIGRSYLLQNEAAKARFAFKKADELSDGRFEVYEEISTALYRHQRFDDALDYLEKARESNPSNVFAYNLKGIIYRQKENHPAAMMAYNHAVKLEPENAGLHYNLGVACFKSGKEKKSEVFFQKAIELDPSLREAGEYLAKLQPA